MAGTVRIKVRGGNAEHGWEDVNLSESFGSFEINQIYYSDLRSERKILKKLKTRLNHLLEAILECKAELRIAEKYLNAEDIKSYKGFLSYYRTEANKIIDLLLDMGEYEYVEEVLNGRKKVV